MYPSYINGYKNGSLKALAESLKIKLKNCDICPRKCKINRLDDEKGFCKTAAKAKVFSYLKHLGEEPAISGKNGSGTIFFSNCNLRCVYCQNYEFSQTGEGREVSEEELAEIMLKLQAENCHNINFVSPTHVTPQIIGALLTAIPKGLKIPLVYNSSGYDATEILKEVEGIFDIYLPDARYADNEVSLKYSSAADYVEINQSALKEMHRQINTIKMNESGVMESGMIIRHLVLPNNLSSTDKVMAFIAKELGKDTYISLMSQYFPCYKSKDYPELSRRLYPEEYQKAIDSMAKYGLYNGWIQDERGLDRFAGINIKKNL